MLDGLKRLFSRPAAVPTAWDAVVVWAEQQRHVFRPVREDGGFVVEGHVGSLPWRLEWGPSQRPYVAGHELRLRADAGVAGDVQAMVLDRALQSSMEHDVFEQYVEGVQTRIDSTTPPEMRWLVMLTELSGPDLGPLREAYAAVGGGRAWVMQWLDGALGQALLTAPLAPGQPLVLMVARGRVTLRTALAEPAPDALEAWTRLFATAVREARRVCDQSAAAIGSTSTQPSLWSATALPPEAPSGGAADERPGPGLDAPSAGPQAPPER
jgi:hypothetical protein